MDYTNETDYIEDAEVICLGSLTVDTVDWLWYPYIPLGKVTILQGDPGEGKTSLALTLAALVSRGVMYGGDKVGRAKNVLYLTAEDGLRDTILPRLIRSKADCNHVFSMYYSMEKPLKLNDPRLAAAIDRHHPELVIIDPLQAFLGADVDMHRANEIRPVMAYLSELAYLNCCAIVLVGHMNKQMGNKSLYRGLGSIDLAASARSVLLMARDPREQDVRVMMHIKSSLAKEGKPQAFRLTEEQLLQWEGDYTGSLTTLMNADSALMKQTREMDAAELLKEALRDGMLPSRELDALAKEQDISHSTLARAKKSLGVYSRKINNVWYCFLPAKPKEAPPEVPPEAPSEALPEVPEEYEAFF